MYHIERGRVCNLLLNNTLWRVSSHWPGVESA